jgi:hypothetical protein
MLPQVRNAPFFPGQPGVSGSDVQRGLRWEPAGIVLYVDENHPNATATADGTNPEYPLTTITLAISRLTTFAAAMAISLEGSVIVVGNEATIDETVIIPPTAPKNCTLLGAGGSRNGPTWAAATAAGTALTIRQEGWVVEGFHFVTGAAGTAITLQWLPGSSYIGYRGVIRNNHFDGAWAGLYGIDFSGAPYDVWIYGNEFREYRTGEANAAAITVTDSAEANPYMCVIRDNVFWENENHIVSLGGARGFNNSIFQGNVFNEGVLIAATLILDLRGGSRGENIVTGNIFPGDYSNTGGYYANAANPGNWNGNLAEDLLEAEVSDSGFTIAPPAA